jgi:hypothetical protein
LAKLTEIGFRACKLRWLCRKSSQAKSFPAMITIITLHGAKTKLSVYEQNRVINVENQNINLFSE